MKHLEENRVNFKNSNKLLSGKRSGRPSNQQLMKPLKTGLSMAELLNAFSRRSSVYIKCRDLGIDNTLVRKSMKNFVIAVGDGLLPSLEFADLILRQEAGEDIEKRLTSEFLRYISETSPSQFESLDSLVNLGDMLNPPSWFEGARQMKRKIIMHLGPTNSGKTYNALQALKVADSGVYLGPLRLLAHEIYERFNKEGIPCNLITGEDRREFEGVNVSACTVEMASLNRQLDVAIIDEIQMLADNDRGWAWTHALLGLQAKEIHVCGEPTALDLVKRLCDSVGEEYEVKMYERLSPLSVEETSLESNLKALKKGDCLITFSRKNIFLMKKIIEKDTKLKCAVVYGALPPETRSEQAKLFNDPNSKFDILVASDAVGMGLNLNIRRIVFERCEKYNGKEVEPLSVSQTKQIAGRAGRFATTNSQGLVTTLDRGDYKFLKETMEKDIPELKYAGLGASLDIIEKFHFELPHLKLAELLVSSISTDIIEPIKGLSLQDKYQFIVSPAKIGSVHNAFVEDCLFKFAVAKAKVSDCHISDFVKLPAEVPNSIEELNGLEQRHSVVMLYLWLSYRFPETFSDVSTALVLKQECERQIQYGLTELNAERQKKFFGYEGATGKKRKEFIEEKIITSFFDPFAVQSIKDPNLHDKKNLNFRY
ncbi:RNA helicase [Clydaea vesicula]|uniref:RNA helicase n=1 Tax=Clydaea vesicula TaxID=447962 RepID=A0AAD5U8A1_9FUNG|nr:RNA helicase [Clydaea vesicula]